MLLKSALLIASVGAVVVGPSSLRAESRSPKPAAIYNTINLDDFDPAMNNDTLYKRVKWSWCTQLKSNSTCVNSGDELDDTIFAVANAMKAKSDAHDCSHDEGETADAQYQIHATGGHCDTTAEEGTIEGGLKTYFDAHGGAVCDVHCVQQTHGGLYTGYLLIAPKDSNIDDVACDGSIPFPSDCGSGGNGDYV